eukprot:Rmarinus@m.25885
MDRGGGRRTRRMSAKPLPAGIPEQPIDYNFRSRVLMVLIGCVVTVGACTLRYLEYKERKIRKTNVPGPTRCSEHANDFMESFTARPFKFKNISETASTLLTCLRSNSMEEVPPRSAAGLRIRRDYVEDDLN